MRFTEVVFISLQLAGCLTAAIAAAPPVWVVDPATPGPDVPPTGASLFDVITTTKDGARDVPFPFEKLLQRLEAAAGCSAGSPCVRSVLLPLGRSLQRVAASPDFFAAPRIVSAVVGEGRGALLRDRLYLGYQQRSDLIEVISYNETAGRFEFQLVKNYREGTQPDVFQARRDTCLACHQNHAPIFSRQVWDETNANPAIAARLGEHHQTFQSIAVRGSMDIPNAIDDATDRANRISLTNALWRDGCGAGSVDAADVGAKCRAGALNAALQFALTGHRAYDANRSFSDEVAATLHRRSQRLWPGGLAIPSPDVPNRNPLATNALATKTDGPALSHVPAAFEPLTPRAPLQILSPNGGELADVLVRGLSASLAANDVQKLRTALAARAANSRERRTYEGRCKVQRKAARVRFDCTGPVPEGRGSAPSGQGGGPLELRGWVDRSSGALDALRVDKLNVVRHIAAASIRWKDANTVTFAPRMHGVAARLPDGAAVESISLQVVRNWPHDQSREPAEASASVSVIDDFAPVRAAIAGILKGRADAVRPLVPARIVAELTSGGADACCDDSIDAKVPVATALVEPAPEAADASELTAPFRSQCGACHHSAETFPPNFLSGDAARVQRALRSCAPRIYVRLAMNELPPKQRDKTPMPPEFPSVLGHRGAASPLRGDLLALRRHIEGFLREEYGRLPQASELLENGYEELRPCLPDTDFVRHENPLAPTIDAGEGTPGERVGP